MFNRYAMMLIVLSALCILIAVALAAYAAFASYPIHAYLGVPHG